jgi:dTDP-glucose pyrophosphorylase
MNWETALLHAESTIQDAIRNLDQSAMQIIMVTDAQGRLVGTITDGDIRRGLLRGLTLSSDIDSLINHNAVVVPPAMSRELVTQLMHTNKIFQLPIVDENRRIVGLHLRDEILTPQGKDNLFVIMAGGKGVRLLPHTENCPKPMLPVAGKPMLEHIIEKASFEGFQNIIISVHYLGHMIEDYFQEGNKWGVRITYLRESAPLGTGGALSLIPKIPELPFLVTNGDVMTDIRYSELLEFHLRHQAAATMAVRQYEWQHPFGVVKTQGVDILGFEEKPMHRSHVNAGIYALNPEALNVMVKGEHCDMPGVFMRLSGKGKRVIVYPMHEPWIDVGREEDLLKANREAQ